MSPRTRLALSVAAAATAAHPGGENNQPAGTASTPGAKA